ncbi:MAG TPA: 30S ribosomal protein S15 [Candidatus Onthovivens sp.]|nr:30S ribosomal protein S15 [Candidatus Onthovivens sp.]
MAINKTRKAEIVKQFGKNAKDTGSCEVQIALLTEEIKNLAEHLKANDKDHRARRALLIFVGQRKSLLKYLESIDRDAYIKILAALGLRK